MTKILHSKYSYFILVDERTDGGIFSTFLFLNRAFWLPLCCISRFQLHLRPRLAPTEEIGEMGQ